MTRPRNVDAEVRADVVVLTALDLEYAAVRAHLTGLRTHTDANGTRYETGQSRAGRCRVALALTGPGNLAAAALTTRAVAWFRPKALILVGVAGGLADDVTLGDLVVATRVHAYHGGRADGGGFRPRPKSWPLAHGLEQEARDVARDGAWTRLLPGEATVPAVHFKPLVSGEVVLDTVDGPIATLIKQHYNDAAAIDMESAGVAEAAHHNDFHQTITVRAVSDLADGSKRNTDATGWQPRAATHAAAFAIALAERIAAGPGSSQPVGASPYRGLAAFRESDAELFFGRTEPADELAALVSTRRFVAVVGRSGSGKSSLVNAGLVPRMRDRGWAIATFRPLPGVPAAVTLAGGLLPLLRPELGPAEVLPHRAVVADAIAGGRLAEVVGDVLAATGASRLLVCVDQFEELVAWSEEAAGELAGLLVWLATGPAAANVVLTVRAETLDVAVHRLGLGEVTRNSVFLLTPMTAEQLRDVVEGPVRQTGVTFEPGLVARILEAARDAPAALTLTQFALTRLWDEQDHGRLTHHAFDAFGGVGGALASYAEHVWAQRLDETQRGQARRLLVQLVRPEGDGETIVRRTARGGELAPELIPLAMHLATTRLLVTGTDATGEITIDLAHAALATHWQRLRGWLAEERDFRAWQEDLRENVRRAEPLRGARLATASRWLRTHPHGIPGPEREFVLASRRRHRRRTAAWRGLLAIIVVLLVAASTFAVNLRQRTDELADQLSRNAAQLLVAEAEERVNTEPELAALLSVAAYRSSQEPAVLANLAAEYLRFRSTDQVLNPGVGEVADLAVSADGNTIAAAGPDGAAVLRLDGPTPAVDRYGEDMGQVALSRDGRLLASATNRGRIELREPDGKVRVLHDENQDDRLPTVLRFDDRGARLLAVSVGELMVWDLARGEKLSVPAAAAASAAAAKDASGNVWFGPDGSSIVTHVSEGLVIWPLNDSPAQVIPLPDPDSSNVLVAGDGRTALTCAGETLVSWDLATMRERERQPRAEDLTCLSPDTSATDHHGRILTTDTFREADSHARDGRLLVNLAADGAARFVVPGPGAGGSVAPGLATTAEGVRLVTAAGAAVNVVDAAPADFTPMNGIDHVNPLLSPDQRYLLTDDYRSQTLALWDTATGASLASVPIRDYLIPLGFVGGGSHVLAVDEEINYVRLFAVPSLRVVARIELPAEMRKNSQRLKFDNFCAADLPGGDEVVFVHAGLVVRLDPRSGATSGPPLRLWRTEEELRRIADLNSCADRPGRAEIAFDVGSRVEVWDVGSGEKVTLPIDDVGRISDLRFSPDGRLLAVMGVNGSLVVWDVEQRRPLTRPQRAIAGEFPGVAGFLAANRVVVSDLNGLRVWDLDRNAAIAGIETLNAGTATVAPDGRSLTYWDSAGLNRIPLDPQRWADHLCRVIGRDLTDAERGALPPGSHPGPIC